MAEATIIEFDIDYGDSNKQTEVLTDNLFDLRKELELNKKAQKELKKGGKEASEGLRNLQKEELKLKDKLAETNRERKKAIDITKIQANTLEGLRKQTKALFAEREKLNTSTVKGSKRFDELTKKLKQNNDEIKKADQSAGAYTSSIGNYSDALKGVSPRAGIFITQLQTAKAGLLSARAGLMANVKALGIFKIALIGTGIGALLIAVGALITFLTRTQRGMDKVSQAMQFAGAIVDELLDRVASLGETLFNAISEPQKLWDGFVDFLKNQLSTRLDGIIGLFSSLGDVIIGALTFDTAQIEKGLSGVGDSLVKVSTGFSSEEIVDGFNAVTDAVVELGEQALIEANAMSELEAQAQALRDAQIGFIVDEARIRKDIAELRLLVKDVNLTDQERLEALKEAIALEDEMFNQKQKLVIEEARISQLRTDMGESTAEELRANAELQAKIFATEEESTKRKLRLASELLTFERLVRRESKEGELEDLDEFLEAEEERIAEAHETEVLANDEKNQKLAESNKKLQDTIVSGSQLASNTLFKALGASLKNEETRINDSFSRRQKSLKEDLKNGLITQSEFDKRSKDLEKTKAIELHKIELARFNQKKVQAFANIAIDIAQAVAKVWAESGLAGIFTQALPIAAGVVQAGIVASQSAPQAPTFAQGGDVKSFLIGGNSHEAGGTTFKGSDGSEFTAEKNEAMFITKKGSATLEAIAHINSLNGGRGLNNVSQFFAEGGSVVTSGTDIDLIQATVTAVLQNVVIVTQVEDIQTGLDDRDDVINAGII